LKRKTKIQKNRRRKKRRKIILNKTRRLRPKSLRSMLRRQALMA
jgi:hypothetical protein